MSLAEQIDLSLKKAMTKRNELETGLYRLIKSAVKNREIEIGHELSDDEYVAVLEKQAKQRQDSIEQYKSAGRNDLVGHEQDELDIIAKFLPDKMGEEEIRKVVKEKVEAMPGQDFGSVMGTVMGELKGKADGGLVQKIVREEMGN